MKASLKLTCFILALCGAAPLWSQVNPYKDPTPGVSGYRAEVLAEVRIQEDKFVRLAEAIPADKYTWRPGDGVRSISEVFLHVAAANYGLPRMIGTNPPEGFNGKDYDKSTTDKAKVIAALKDSFAHWKKAILDMPDSELEKSIDWFGGKSTKRGFLLFAVRHTAEHLGQSIAYARDVNVTPPWTEDQQREQQKKKEAEPKKDEPKK